MASQLHPRFKTPPAIRPMLVTLLAGGLWLAGDRPAVRAQGPAGAGLLPLARRSDSTSFGTLKQRTAEQRQKAGDDDQPVPPRGEARAKTREQLGLTLAEIDARLQPTGPPLPLGAPGDRIQPGMRVDVIMEDGANWYSGALVGVDGTKVLLQTIPLPGAKPSAFDLSAILAFRTDFGTFAYSPRIGRMVPAQTRYRLNNATGNFERMSAGTGDIVLADNAQVVGPISVALARYEVAANGSWALGLPMTEADSPDVIPAYRLQQIITSKGVYAYDDATKDYQYTSHAQYAEAARAARDTAGQAYYDRQWERKVQTIRLGTERVQAFSSGSGGASVYAEVGRSNSRWPWGGSEALPRSTLPPGGPGALPRPPLPRGGPPPLR